MQTGRKLEQNKPDILTVDKQTGECQIIVVASPFDTRVKEKEQGKIERYHGFNREIGRFRQCKKVVVISIITGPLGTIGKGFRTWIRNIKMDNYCDLMQKACLPGTVPTVVCYNLLSRIFQPSESDQ